MKRKLIFVVVIALCFYSLSIISLAAETPNYITICVNQGSLKQYLVIRSGNDILFSGEDLESITGYTYHIDGNNAVFSRGCKTLRVDIGKSTVYPMEDIGAVAFVEKIQKEGNKYYYPASQMLPWMNVTCFVENGALCVLADEISFWDIIGDFNPEDHTFNYLECCKELGVNSKWLKASAYVLENGVKMVFDVIPVTLDMTYGSYKDYYEIFDDFFKNKDSAAYAFKELTSGAEEIKSAFDIIEDLGQFESLPDEFKALSSWATALAKISDLTDLAVFYASCQEDNSDKIECMQSISLNRENYKYPEAMVAAAMQIEDDYADVWKGIETRVVFQIGDVTVDGLIDGTTGVAKKILDIIEMPSKLGFDWASAVDRISKYDVISACCLDVIEQRTGTWLSTIRDLRCHALLYLYSCEQNWRTMAGYAKSKNQLELAEAYTSKADNALAWQGKFLSTALAQENDSHEYRDGIAKQQYTEELLGMFAGLINIDPADTQILLGTWNLYGGGTRDKKGNWFDLFMYTIMLSGDGTAEISSGVVKSEYNAGYIGTWSAVPCGDSQFQIQLNVTGGNFALGETLPQYNCCVLLRATITDNLLTCEKISGDETCLVYGEAYERDLSSNTWEERQLQKLSSSMPDSSYLGEWSYGYISDGKWDRTLTINSIEGNTIHFDLLYYRIANFTDQIATINADGTASFTVTDESYSAPYNCMSGILAFEDSVTVYITHSSLRYVDADLTEYTRG